MLLVQDITKIYQVGTSTVKALDRVNFEVEDGEFVVITGTSGSGKSTLLHLIAGVDFPTSGNVLVDGENISQLSKTALAAFRRKHIGIIYQSFNLVSTLTVEENMVLPLILDGRKADSKKVFSLLERLGLSERRKHLPNQLSGGQQQRVAIGRALITKPSLLLADEPTGNLDSKNTTEILELFKIANKEYGITVLLVTHDRYADNFANRSIVLIDGRII